MLRKRFFHIFFALFFRCFFFLFIFALTFHKCQIGKRAFLSFLFFAFFKGVLGAALLLFPSGFLCTFLFVFSILFSLFLGSFLALGAGRRAALFSVGLFVCVSVFFFF